MKIRFLRVVEAPQEHTEYCGDGCCSWPAYSPTWFEEGEEADPEEYGRKIKLDGLKYKEDFEITEYP